MILIIPRPQAGRLPASGCWPIASLAFLLPPLWRARAEVEHDEALLQPIAYLLCAVPPGRFGATSAQGATRG